MSRRVRTFADSDRHTNPLLDASWKRVDTFREEGPQRSPERLKGSPNAVIDSREDEGVVRAADEVDETDADSDLQNEGRRMDAKGPESRASHSQDPEAEENEAWEYEEDEIYVTLDLGKPGLQQIASVDCAITGLDTDTPWLKLGRTLYKGEWHELYGSEILLHDAKNSYGQRELRPLASATTVTKQTQGPSITSHRILFTPVRRAESKSVQETTRAAANHLAEFKHFPGLAVHDASTKQPKKPMSEMTYAEKWQDVLDKALARREKAAAKGRLDPVRSTRGIGPYSRKMPEVADDDNESGQSNNGAGLGWSEIDHKTDSAA
ncbi:hypothetical protein K437DRAFT_273058 [Tilletiaria anomala UBC 951]|uniref:Transcription factor TFIIIC triple barrel domain-containing protein n=1 Tax=Tilletiaria anomala (strain ATCC 24038 / CBS 436.72 / UBC 951) TaxID=1037660 RepID=A0A066WEB6_TILAU|nr:uncharacterized protein K437DRAFT_273058 [Tilletiaria anomala UBC 951]KDN50848.1 hypothetical protein K437DRAFT_273058 [Tilletiaria anomala UBC 951]